MISCENRGFQNHRQLECSFSSLTGLTRNKSLNILITVSFRNEFPYKRWFLHRKAQYCRKSPVRCFIYHDDVMIQFQKLYHDVIMVNKTPDSRKVAYNPLDLDGHTKRISLPIVTVNDRDKFVAPGCPGNHIYIYQDRNSLCRKMSSCEIS